MQKIVALVIVCSLFSLSVRAEQWKAGSRQPTVDSRWWLAGFSSGIAEFAANSYLIYKGLPSAVQSIAKAGAIVFNLSVKTTPDAVYAGVELKSGQRDWIISVPAAAIVNIVQAYRWAMRLHSVAAIEEVAADFTGHRPVIRQLNQYNPLGLIKLPAIRASEFLRPTGKEESKQFQQGLNFVATYQRYFNALVSLKYLFDDLSSLGSQRSHDNQAVDKDSSIVQVIVMSEDDPFISVGDLNPEHAAMFGATALRVEYRVVGWNVAKVIVAKGRLEDDVLSYNKDMHKAARRSLEKVLGREPFYFKGGNEKTANSIKKAFHRLVRGQFAPNVGRDQRISLNASYRRALAIKAWLEKTKDIDAEYERLSSETMQESVFLRDSHTAISIFVEVMMVLDKAAVTPEQERLLATWELYKWAFNKLDIMYVDWLLSGDPFEDRIGQFFKFMPLSELKRSKDLDSEQFRQLFLAALERCDLEGLPEAFGRVQAIPLYSHFHGSEAKFTYLRRFARYYARLIHKADTVEKREGFVFQYFEWAADAFEFAMLASKTSDTKYPGGNFAWSKDGRAALEMLMEAEVIFVQVYANAARNLIMQKGSPIIKLQKVWKARKSKLKKAFPELWKEYTSPFAAEVYQDAED